jgi:hypothetical protein
VPVETVEEAEPTIIPQPLVLVNPIEVSPQLIGLEHSFSFTFNQPVDTQSFAEGFIIEPETSGELNWENETSVTFVPTNPLQLGTHYSVLINTDVYAKNGEKLSTPITQNFITIGPLERTDQYPADQTAGLDILTPIWVSFNQPVASTSADTPIPFTIEPAVPGAGRWANPSTYIFYPSEEMISATTYTISYKSIASLYGARYETIPEDTTFSTQNPTILTVTPEDLSVLEPGQDIVITFNQAMDQESVIANLRIEDKDSQQILPEFVWNENSSQLTIKGGSYFSRGNTVLVVLNPAAKTSTGISLNESTRRQYATYPDLSIDEKPASSLEVESSGYTELRFHANVPLDPDQDFLSLIDIRPRTPGEFSAELDSTGQTLTYSGFFVPGAFYSYSLSPDMVDEWGVPLGSVVLNRFATKAAPSVIMIDQSTTPPSHLFFPLDDIQIPVETNNIRRVDMQSVALSIPEYIALYCDYSDCLQFKEFEYTRFWYQSVYPYIINTMIPSELTMAPRFRTLESGIYVFELDSPDLKSRDALRYFGIAADIALNSNQIKDELLIWAIDLNTNEPIANASILIYDSNAAVVDGGNTDAYGLLRIKGLNSGIYHIATGNPGQENFGLNTITMLAYETPKEDPLTSADFFFDRPTYHPGNTINFLVYPNNAIADDLLVQLIYEYAGQENLLEEIQLQKMPGVGLQGMVRIPSSLPLGTYTLVLLDHDIHQPIKVADPKISRVSIQQTNSDDGIAFGDEINGNFVLLLDQMIPIPGQTLVWKAIIPSTGFSIEGICVTDEKGLCPYTVPNTAYLGLPSDLTSQLILSVNSDFTDTIELFINIFPGDIDIEILPETWLGYAGDVFGVEINTRKNNREILPSVDLEARFEKISFYDETSFIEGEQVTTRAPEGTQIASTNFTTDENGYARLTFTPPETGLYRISVHTESFSAEKWFLVDGIEPGEWLEDQNSIMTVTDQERYQAGDTAQLFIPNPFDQPATVLLLIQSQTDYRTQVFTVEGATKTIDFTIKDTDFPHIQVKTILLGSGKEGRSDFRESTLDLEVTQDQPALSIESELILDEDQKAYFKINVLDDLAEPVEARFSLLVLPTDWLDTQPETNVFFTTDAMTKLDASSDLPLQDYIRTNGWVYEANATKAVDQIASAVFSSPPYQTADSIFLTNLSTSETGESFIEFPFTKESDRYTYFVAAISDDGTTGNQMERIDQSDTIEVQTNHKNLTFGNILSSPGREDIIIPVSSTEDSQSWQLELYSSEVTLLNTLLEQTPFDHQQPVTVASTLLTAANRNAINDTQLALEPYIQMLQASQNEDGGWGYITGQASDIHLTNYIAYCIIESGAMPIMAENNLLLLSEYLSGAIAMETSTKASSRFSLQALTLTYQELSEVIAQAQTLSIPEQVWLIQGLAQQSQAELQQDEILKLILPRVLFDEFGAFFPGDGSNPLFGADESVTAFVLLVLYQVEPASELIIPLRNWLLHQIMTDNLIEENPVAYPLVFLALERTLQYIPSTENYSLQVLQGNQTIARFTAEEIKDMPFQGTFRIVASSSVLSVIHEEGSGNLYYRISRAEETVERSFSNGIELSTILYPAGDTCRPGYCVNNNEYTLDELQGLIEIRLTLTVIEYQDHVVIELPKSRNYQVNTTTEIFSQIIPPLTSPLEYGLQQNVFITDSNSPNNITFYAANLMPGSYEVLFYLHPLQEGAIAIPSIIAYDLFTGTKLAYTSPMSLDVKWEQDNE